MNNNDLSKLEEKIGYFFSDKLLLRQALTHSSFANEQKINKSGDYERLEFLGDAVLEVVSSEFLFHKYPDMPEGKLTKLRASMVCESSLAMCARDIDLGSYIFLGKGEEATGGRNRESITSDVMEAIIGAIFLDGGMEKAKLHINRFILSDLEDKALFYDSKSRLQEVLQAKGAQVPSYELVWEEGPDHARLFTVRVRLADGRSAEAQGQSKIRLLTCRWFRWEKSLAAVRGEPKKVPNSRLLIRHY